MIDFMIVENLKKIIHRRYNISFAKSGDDIQLSKLINQHTPGTYVDIGCWHPYKASNTYYFHLRNWKGICIDPNPTLKPLYDKFRNGDTFINCGIGNLNDSLKYYMFEESSMNTFSEGFVLKHNLQSQILKVIDVPLKSLEKILDENILDNDRLDFFDIDVEGYDLEVLKTNNWNKYRPRIIVVESDVSIKDDLTSDITKYIESQDYRLLGKSVINGSLGNLFYVIK